MHRFKVYYLLYGNYEGQREFVDDGLLFYVAIDSADAKSKAREELKSAYSDIPGLEIVILEVDYDGDMD